MKWDEFRRSKNVEDYTDPNKPTSGTVFNPDMTIREVITLTSSDLAKEAGSEDINKGKI